MFRLRGDIIMPFLKIGHFDDKTQKARSKRIRFCCVTISLAPCFINNCRSDCSGSILRSTLGKLELALSHSAANETIVLAPFHALSLRFPACPAFCEVGLLTFQLQRLVVDELTPIVLSLFHKLVVPFHILVIAPAAFLPLSLTALWSL